MTTHASRPAPRRTLGMSAVRLPTLIIGVCLAAYLIARPESLDLAAAEYRAQLFGQTGLSIWDLQWYGGHYLPAYSVLVPALSWLIGVRALGAAAVLAATVLFQRIVEPRDARGYLAVTCFGLGGLASLLSGRITFTTGIPVALTALLIDQRRRRAGGAAAVLSVSALTALFSPVASLFLAVVWTSRLLRRRSALYAAAVLATFLPILELNLAFPETGVEPMSLGAVLPVALCAATLIGLSERRERTLVLTIVLYLGACILTALLHTPVGSNVLRLGPLCAPAVAALTLAPRRRWMLLPLGVALLYWQWYPAIRDVSSATGNRTTQASFYRPLLGYLNRVSGPMGEAAHGGFRVEIPFTQLHWEARWVAPHYALARGWERQVDIADNGLFYHGHLTPPAYDRWLHANAVRYVAVPRSPLDASAQQERTIIASHPSFLTPTWSSRNWQVFAVADPTPLSSGPGHLVALSSDTVRVAMAGGTSDVLRVRWNPYWALERGWGCVSRAGTWTRLWVPDRATVTLGERFSIMRIGSHRQRCVLPRRRTAY
jgi:hypothetical protein